MAFPAEGEEIKLAVARHKNSVRHGTGDAVTAIEYSPAGDVTKVTLPDGSFLAYT